jgi:hypothetical protein
MNSQQNTLLIGYGNELRGGEALSATEQKGAAEAMNQIHGLLANDERPMTKDK